MEGSPENPDFHNPDLEEILAEGPRKDFVAEFYGGVTEQLLKENSRERRKNSALNQRLVEIEQQADHDPVLTELLNRRGFESALGEIRKTGITGALLMVDIDKFKDLNDRYGHPVGDLVLRAAAKRLKARCRESDQVARWGGEEFLAFFPNATAADILKKFTPEEMDKAVINIEFNPTDPHAPKIDITFSGGITNLGKEESLEAAIQRADDTLYRVKNSGRNRLEIATEATSASVRY